jgi:hypothetical protein
MGGAQAPISVLHRAISKRWAPFSATFFRPYHSLRLSVGAHGQHLARVLDIVASRHPRPYHFRALIQSFQAVAAPFPGDSVLPSDPLARGRNASVQKFAPDWAREAATRPGSKRPADLEKHPSMNLVSPKEKSTQNRRPQSEPPPLPGLEQPRAGHPGGAFGDYAADAPALDACAGEARA